MNNYQREWLRRHYETIYKPAYVALMKFYPLGLEDLPGEVWQPIPDYDGYQVSSFGRVKRIYKNGKQRVLKPMLNRNGYLEVCLSKNDKKKLFRIHRLVALCFIPNPDNKPHINHIDGCKFNNFVENLEWVTGSENIRHAFDTGLLVGIQGENRSDSKLSNEQARYIRENPNNLTQRQLADLFGIHQVTIGKIQRGERYKSAGGAARQSKFKRIPEEIKAQICAEYQASVRGCGCKVLAKKYGVASRTILNIIHEAQS